MPSLGAILAWVRRYTLGVIEAVVCLIEAVVCLLFLCIRVAKQTLKLAYLGYRIELCLRANLRVYNRDGDLVFIQDCGVGSLELPRARPEGQCFDMIVRKGL